MFIKLCDSGYVNIHKVTYFDIDTDIESYSNAPENTYASVDIYFENDSAKAGYWLTKKEYDDFLQQLEQYRIPVSTGSWRAHSDEIL